MNTDYLIKNEDSCAKYRMPTEIGSTVYLLHEYGRDNLIIIPCRVDAYNIRNDGILVLLFSLEKDVSHFEWHKLSGFGETIFLTKQDAQNYLNRESRCSEIELPPFRKEGDSDGGLIADDRSQAYNMGWNDCIKWTLVTLDEVAEFVLNLSTNTNRPQEFIITNLPPSMRGKFTAKQIQTCIEMRGKSQ